MYWYASLLSTRYSRFQKPIWYSGVPLSTGTVHQSSVLSSLLNGSRLFITYACSWSGFIPCSSGFIRYGTFAGSVRSFTRSWRRRRYMRLLAPPSGPMGNSRVARFR
jgi:hypothetical protein